MKRLSLQWRITLLTALLIACACVCMNLLLYRTGATGMDALNGFMMQYQPGSLGIHGWVLLCKQFQLRLQNSQRGAQLVGCVARKLPL